MELGSQTRHHPAAPTHPHRPVLRIIFRTAQEPLGTVRLHDHRHDCRGAAQPGGNHAAAVLFHVVDEQRSGPAGLLQGPTRLRLSVRRVNDRRLHRASCWLFPGGYRARRGPLGSRLAARHRQENHVQAVVGARQTSTLVDAGGLVPLDARGRESPAGLGHLVLHVAVQLARLGCILQFVWPVACSGASRGLGELRHQYPLPVRADLRCAGGEGTHRGR